MSLSIYLNSINKNCKKIWGDQYPIRITEEIKPVLEDDSLCVFHN